MDTSSLATPSPSIRSATFLNCNSSSTIVVTPTIIPKSMFNGQVLDRGPDYDPERVSRRAKASESEPESQKTGIVKSVVGLFRGEGKLRPFRLLRKDLGGRPKLYHTDWFFNQLILASAVYVFFTNLLPGITFASDLYQLTSAHYGTIEVVFSTGLCGLVFSLYVQPLSRVDDIHSMVLTDLQIQHATSDHPGSHRTILYLI